jgi:predicted O-methyltransferase YrrM
MKDGIDEHTSPRPIEDPKIKQVLDVYQARIVEEQKKIDAASHTQHLSGDWRNDLLLPVGADAGRLINILVKSLKAPRILELGTSYGYSGIWLAEAARSTGGRLITMELHANKSKYAKEMSEKAGLSSFVDFQVGDAEALIDALPHGIDFVLVDLWKDLYVPCLEWFYPKLNPGAIIVADNMTFPGGEEVVRYAQAVRAKPGIRSVQLPV